MDIFKFYLELEKLFHFKAEEVRKKFPASFLALSDF